MALALPCHLIRNPAGTFHFVGRVPDALAFESSDPAYIEAAKQSGPGIAARIAKAQGGTFRSLSWPCEADAYAAAAALGYAVPSRDDAATPGPADYARAARRAGWKQEAPDALWTICDGRDSGFTAETAQEACAIDGLI